jgi:hypothetical protein
MSMSISEAVKIASSVVYMPSGNGTSWSVIGPYYDDKPNGPTTENTRSSYWAAREVRTSWAARIALVLMGWESCDAGEALIDVTGSVAERVKKASQTVSVVTV